MGWTLSSWNGSVFVSGDDLDFPWESPVEDSGGIQVRVLADGSRGAIIPETVGVSKKLKFSWSVKSQTFISRIRTYRDAGTILKLTDLNSNVYYGIFTDLDISDMKVDGGIYYQIRAIFEEIDDPS